MGHEEIAPADVPKPTIARLVLYLRELQQMSRGGILHVRSRALAERLGLTDSQVRRDLSHLGQVGRRGVGYPVRELSGVIRTVLGTDRQWRVILIGAGNLGQALSGYKGFAEQGFELAGVFDSEPHKIGTVIHGHQVRAAVELEAFVEGCGGIDMAIVAVPASHACNVVSRLSELGVLGILNFAPVSVRRQSGDAIVLDVDLALELQRLASHIVRR